MPLQPVCLSFFYFSRLLWVIPEFFFPSLVDAQLRFAFFFSFKKKPKTYSPQASSVLPLFGTTFGCNAAYFYFALELNRLVND